jgi:hypothetical protein
VIPSIFLSAFHSINNLDQSLPTNSLSHQQKEQVKIPLLSKICLKDIHASIYFMCYGPILSGWYRGGGRVTHLNAHKYLINTQLT